MKTGRACNIPGLGKYADSSGDEQSCNNPTGGFNTFLLNTGAVETATDCGFSCNAGFVKKTVGRNVRYPRYGKIMRVTQGTSKVAIPPQVSQVGLKNF